MDWEWWPVPWPARSPDFNPLNPFLWGLHLTLVYDTVWNARKIWSPIFCLRAMELGTQQVSSNVFGGQCHSSALCVLTFEAVISSCFSECWGNIFCSDRVQYSMHTWSLGHCRPACKTGPVHSHHLLLVFCCQAALKRTPFLDCLITARDCNTECWISRTQIKCAHSCVRCRASFELSYNP
jgi:hypothetical protein